MWNFREIAVQVSSVLARMKTSIRSNPAFQINSNPVRNTENQIHNRIKNGLSILQPFSTFLFLIQNIPNSNSEYTVLKKNRIWLNIGPARSSRRGWEGAPGCFYIGHWLPCSRVSKRGGTKWIEKGAPGSWRLQLACKRERSLRAGASLPCWAAHRASGLLGQAWIEGV